MTILVIASLYPKDLNHSINETSWAIEELVKGLKYENIKVKRVIRPSGEVSWKKFKRNKVNYRSQINGTTIDSKSFINISKNYFYFRKGDIDYFKELLKDVDLIVAHMRSSAVIADKLYKLFKKPYIYILHNSDLSNLEQQKKLFLNAKGVYSRSWALKNRLEEKNLKIDGIVFSGIEKELILNRKHTNKIIKFITVSMLRNGKNIDTILHSLAELPPNLLWEYTIIGDGDNYQKIYYLIKQLNLNDKVKMLGFKERIIAIKYMQNSDIFIMPSAPETFGLAYLEAMASGCIIICAKGYGIDGLIKNGKNGYTIEAKNIELLKELLIKILTNNQNEVYKKSINAIKSYTLDQAQKNYANIIRYYYHKVDGDNNEM